MKKPPASRRFFLMEGAISPSRANCAVSRVFDQGDDQFCHQESRAAYYAYFIRFQLRRRYSQEHADCDAGEHKSTPEQTGITQFCPFDAVHQSAHPISGGQIVHLVRLPLHYDAPTPLGIEGVFPSDDVDVAILNKSSVSPIYHFSSFCPNWG